MNEQTPPNNVKPPLWIEQVKAAYQKGINSQVVHYVEHYILPHILEAAQTHKASLEFELVSGYQHQDAVFRAKHIIAVLQEQGFQIGDMLWKNPSFPGNRWIQISGWAK